ncbi:hypothetical protein GFU95_01300 [Apibacter sp. B3889]|uniref:hypothetical protein n=1 Tax=unclassified Apibacter TaxID=2630820 RepID=UPI001324C3C2|nr:MULTISPECIES: hypothetical protein [unclassified Apibacter]MXO33651.1 hypothetical protein [Apibacter sp. B3883]MXO41008.1 hypothetical protein [Apibacter sp. B3889]MXP04177.1 hypothetical protein [Apibacter sp. B3887]MXP07012.1 hypothetical protein [Apibacter sp. B3935]
MECLFNSISEFISPEIVSNISKILNEKESNIIQALHTTTASLLELILEKGEQKKLEFIFKGIGTMNILFSVSNLFLDPTNLKKHCASSKFLIFLLKDRLEEYYSLIASSSQISIVNSKNIVNKLGLLISAFLGEKIISNISYVTILNQLQDERNDFQIYIPFEMSEILDEFNVKAYLEQKFWISFF